MILTITVEGDHGSGKHDTACYIARMLANNYGSRCIVKDGDAEGKFPANFIGDANVIINVKYKSKDGLFPLADKKREQ